MKIGLILENSQADKNEIVYNELVGATQDKGHQVINYGMLSSKDPHVLTYVQNGLLAAILLNTKAVDFVVTGCGTGQGAMVACNAMPGVVCGHIKSPLDAYLFGQVNGGNAIAINFAQEFGWGGELNLRYIFEKLFAAPFGGGYPIERREPEQRNAKILNDVKQVTHTPLLEVLKNIDPEFLKGTIDYQEFKELFFKAAQDGEVKNFIQEFLNK